MINLCNFTKLKHGVRMNTDDLPVLSIELLKASIEELLASYSVRILAFFAMPNKDLENTEKPFHLIAILLDASTRTLLGAAAEVGTRYTAFTPLIPALHLFEREIAEQYNITPEGHPWLKPVRSQNMTDADDAAQEANTENPADSEAAKFFRLSGKATHEVAVGPVHAGVIEPGHFRFQCLGEDVHHLEIALGYQHRGIEAMLKGGPDLRSLHFAETVSGDTTIASVSNYAAIIEALSYTTPSGESLLLRNILLELERIVNHAGDIGALAGDVAYLPTSSYCGRIRGEYLNMTAEVAGNRFGRNVIIPGGMRTGLSSEKAEKLLNWLYKTKYELDVALDIMLDEPTALDRFEGLGTITEFDARTIGAVGVAARAAGLDIDARFDLPPAGEDTAERLFPFSSSPIPACSGDVISRIKIRRHEIENSHAWLFEVLKNAIEKPFTNIDPPKTSGKLAPDSFAVAVTEAWRGELVHVVFTDEAGRFKHYKIIDPSFRNWFALALSLREEQISDFPICNKSFNLSYCGHDL